MPISIHTEAERLAHPQICFIPMKFIELCPDRSLFEFELHCIAASEAELEAVWDDYQHFFPSVLPAQAKINFLALVLWGHPTITVERIVALAVYGDFSLFHLVQTIAMTGRKDLLDKLVEQHGFDRVIEAALADDGEDLNAVLLAIAFNELDIYHWFFARLSSKQVDKLVTRDACAYFQLAAAKGHCEVLTWLADRAPEQLFSMIRISDFQAFRMAAYHGHLEVLAWLAEQAPSQLLGMIKANKFQVFRSAAQHGHLEVLKWVAEQAPTQLLMMIKCFNFEAFRLASESGFLDVLKWLIEQVPDQLPHMITASDFHAFRWAAINGHLEVLKWLAEQAPTQVLTMISASDFEAFRWAAKNGHLEILKWLAEQAPAQLLSMIRTANFQAFRLAAQNGQLKILEWLASKAPGQLHMMIKSFHFAAFRLAAENGLEALQWLAEQAPAKLLTMINASDFEAFRKAAENGHLTVLKWLADKAPTQLPTMIETFDYEAFREAAKNGHLAVLKWLAEQVPAQLPRIIGALDCKLFRLAAENGHLDVLQWLAEQAPTQLLTMIKASDFEAFRKAAENGHLDILQWLAKQQVPEQFFMMVKACGFEAFRGAIKNAHLEILKWLAGQAPTQFSMMSKLGNFEFFRLAAQNGHLKILKWLAGQAPGQLFDMIGIFFDPFRLVAQSGHLKVLKWLMEQVTPAQLADLLRADHCGIFAAAVSNGDIQLIGYLLSMPILFEHVEAHELEYKKITHPFLAERMLDLRARSQVFERANPQGVFDVATEEANWYFYAMRHLIRRNDPALLDDLRFLLSLPRLKNLAHQDSQQRAGGNELLRLAQSVGNSAAAQILLAIPAVRNLAEANHYYRAERRGELDLSALANDRESSMRALTEGEQRRLAIITDRYQPKLRSEGVEFLFEQLLSELRARYIARPAAIKQSDGVDLLLPPRWMEFVALKLNKETYEGALKAYYQHPDHTALRYLSKPNRWMAPNASYVYINETRTERWSTFEEYKSLIVLLWLAAQDIEAIPTDDYTVETRITHFIRELAYIGRAHNWDRSRPKLAEKGRLSTEEYDDEEGDKPSCYSGVKRRLFQALQGHPDMLFLSAERVKQELREYLRQHFKMKIERDENPQELCAAWEACILLEAERAGALGRLNLNEAEQEAFSIYLIEKYGTVWLEDPQLKRLVDQAFKIEHPDDKWHALKFAGLVNLETLLPISTAETGVTERKECEDEAYSAASPRFGR